MFIFFNFFRNIKEFNKFDVVGKPRLGGTLQVEIFWKKEKLKLKKMKMKIFNILYKKNYQFQILITKISILSDHENIIFILIYKLFLKIYQRISEKNRGLQFAFNLSMQI